MKKKTVSPVDIAALGLNLAKTELSPTSTRLFNLDKAGLTKALGEKNKELEMERRRELIRRNVEDARKKQQQAAKRKEEHDEASHTEQHQQIVAQHQAAANPPPQEKAGKKKKKGKKKNKKNKTTVTITAREPGSDKVVTLPSSISKAGLACYRLHESNYTDKLAPCDYPDTCACCAAMKFLESSETSVSRFAKGRNTAEDPPTAAIGKNFFRLEEFGQQVKKSYNIEYLKNRISRRIPSTI